MARWKLFDLNVWNTILSSVAPSTQQSYRNIFFQFVSFFEDRGLDFSSISVNEVLLFLQTFVGKSKSRVRTAVAALKFFLKVYHREDLATHSLIDMFGKGAQNKAPLPREKTSIWNPESVLQWLKSQPIPSSFLSSAKEAVLLLLLATGWRIDDVWKLSSRMERSDESVRFFFRAKRKCLIKGKFTLSQRVARFTSCPRVCPIEAIDRFLVQAKKLRKRSLESLFVSSFGDPASKDTLRRWVVDLLTRAGVMDSAGSCRSATTSAAFAKNHSIDDIMRSAGWSSASTFRKYYQREVLPTVAPLNLMSME
jgi:site-specific recombinase XerD